MNLLLLNQCFYPDVVATAQQLTDLAVGLRNEGHEVTVITSDRGYDNPARRFPRREVWNGINIIRISSLAIGKETRWRRALNFASFLTVCAGRLALQPRYDAVIALTSPPLISFLGSMFTRIKGGKFFFWVMDLNPDEAVAAGWLRQHSRSARIFARLLRSSLLHAEHVIALDHFMKKRIVEKGIEDGLVTVLPPWSYNNIVAFDPQGREAFRKEHHLDDRFVVMYSGNHSPCHPLDTLLQSARLLTSEKQIVFCFVGGGSEQAKVQDFARVNNLENIHCLPYQKLDQLSASLSAADLHAVVMGDDFVGIVHPSKIYNILAVGSPFLYIGPEHSHLSEIVASLSSEPAAPAYTARNGDAETVARQILQAASHSDLTAPRTVPLIAKAYARELLLPRMIRLLESVKAEETQPASEQSQASVMSAAR
ncbi:MAG TPA: glycosyltransferase family 4 protein [Pyrinomonadaceae bacterium]|nr:glycosyltransferase family 4 protein [Pyrinomonadaceae bacterium]